MTLSILLLQVLMDLSDEKNDRHVRRAPEHDQHNVQDHPEGQPGNDADNEAPDRAVFDEGRGLAEGRRGSMAVPEFLAIVRGVNFLFHPTHLSLYHGKSG